MSIFKRIFSKSSSEPVTTGQAEEQAVLVFLDGTGLSPEIYKQYDLGTLEGRLREVIEQGGLGEYDGNEMGPTQTTLYMYGPDAENLLAGIEGTLRSYPLCQAARVVIRQGGPGARERELRL